MLNYTMKLLHIYVAIYIYIYIYICVCVFTYNIYIYRNFIPKPAPLLENLQGLTTQLAYTMKGERERESIHKFHTKTKTVAWESQHTRF
jgi:hypothetical protein